MCGRCRGAKRHGSITARMEIASIAEPKQQSQFIDDTHGQAERPAERGAKWHGAERYGARGLSGNVWRRSPHPVFWLMAVAMVVIATTYVLRSDASFFGGPAFGQPVSSGGARGVFAFSGQLSKGTYGVYMVDVDAMTIWVYEYIPQKGCLRLAAARAWLYDRYLENYNSCDLPPEVVEQMIGDQRRYRLEKSESQMP